MHYVIEIIQLYEFYIFFFIMCNKSYRMLKVLTGSLRAPTDLIKIFEVPSSNKIRTWTEPEAEAAAAAAACAAAAASFAFLDEPPLGITGILGGSEDSNIANLSRHVSQATILALPESTIDQSPTL